jgi:hypothetical protein
MEKSRKFFTGPVSFFLTTSDFVPPGNIWQYLETLLFVTTKGVELAASGLRPHQKIHTIALI